MIYADPEVLILGANHKDHGIRLVHGFQVE